MSKQKLTDWFDSDVKPVHVGVYQTNGESRSYQHWNGKEWGWCSARIETCFTANEGCKSDYQNVKWRGLAEQPK